jgi:hypothetical protein
MCMFTAHQGWFERVCNLTEEEEVLFDQTCKGILGRLYECLEVSLNGKPGSLEFCFHLQVYKLLWKDKACCALFEKLPADMRGRKTGCVLVQSLSRLLAGWMYSAMSEMSMDLNRDLVPLDLSDISYEDQKSENNRYFGWAIYSMRSKMIKAQADDCVDFLTKMRIYHGHAIQDKEYMRHCYSQIDRLRNDGFLTLVAKPYFDVGLHLLKRIRLEFNKSRFEQLGNQAIKEAFARISEDQYFLDEFMACPNAAKLSSLGKKKLWFELVKKTFHARVHNTVRNYREETTGRLGAVPSGTAFRVAIGVKSAKKK